MIIETALAMLLQSSSAEAFRTRAIDPYALCSCKAADEKSVVRFTGYANDAELTLNEDGQQANARQATIFRVTKGRSDVVAALTKVFHLTDPAKCGVSFDYGRRYEIIAVKKDGVLETNWCVMGKPRKAE